MLFRELLTQFRERSGISKSEWQKSAVGVSAEYIINVEKGQTKRPPTIDRCREIASVLELSEKEKQRLIDAAMLERLSQEALEWHIEKMKSYNLKNGKLEETGETEFVRVPLYSLKEYVTIKKSSPLPKTHNYVLAPKRGNIMIAVTLIDEVAVVDMKEKPKTNDHVLACDGKTAAVYNFADVPKEMNIIGIVVMSIKNYR